MDVTRLVPIVLGSILVNNFVLAKFLGLCPFIGVSKKTEDALGMGLAVTFVMSLASAVTWLIYRFVLLAHVESGSNLFYQLGIIGEEQSLVPFLKTVSYILVIATLVQLVEMIIRKVSPPLYRALGIYLPLITTNCAVMGVALLNTTDSAVRLSFLEAIIQGASAGIGFSLAMLLMSGVRERLEVLAIPESLKGVPIAFICTGLMALAFLGFSGLV
jgi:electron transport complex protein RnfA